MLKSESFLNRSQAQARIALDDDAADADGVELTRLLLRKTAHAHKMLARLLDVRADPCRSSEGPGRDG